MAYAFGRASPDSQPAGPCRLINQWSKYRSQLEILNGIAIGISFVYAVVFAPLMPLAVIAILFGGMGLLPLAPLSAFAQRLIFGDVWPRCSTIESIQPLHARGTMSRYLS